MPKKHKKENKLMSEQLRRLIETCGISRYAISKRSGITESALSRFMSGERGLSTDVLDKLGEVLDLEVIMHGPNTSEG